MKRGSLISHIFSSLPSLSPQPAQATSVSVSTLPNGVTVVTEGSCVNSTVTLTYPKAGSANETLDEQGAALLNKFMSFKSGSGISTIVINRAIEDAGGIPRITVDRTKATLGYTVTRENAARLIPLLAVDCSFEKWDFRDAMAVAQIEVEVAGESAEICLTENLYAAAYGPQSPGGRSFYFTKIDADTVAGFRARAYGLNGAVLTATGVKDHSAFCTEVSELLSSCQPGNTTPPASLTYMGGESRVFSPCGYTHVALAFKAPESLAVGSVVKHLISIAGKESGVSGFSAPGVVGAYAGGLPGKQMDSIIAALKTPISAANVKRAKGLAKAEALFALDGGSQSLADFMTAAALNEAVSFTSPADLAKTFDAVTDTQVKEAVAGMFKSNPSLAAVGDIGTIPYHATVAPQFK